VAVADALRLVGIGKSFPGVVALDDVTVGFRAGAVHAVMGENGAGKSTLMRIAAGVHPPDSGQVEVGGAPVTLARPSDAHHLGVHTVFQELTVLDNLDVGRNVLLGREPTRFAGTLLDRRALYRRAQEVLDDLGITLDARTPVDGLSVGQKQMVEIARACVGEPRVLVLDEPTSSLGRHEEELLFRLVERLRARGVAVVYISHRMAEVFRLADDITVLRDGRHVLTAPASELDSGTLVRSMVGRDVPARERTSDHEPGPVVLTATGLRSGSRVRGVSLEVRAGQVLGVGGLMGSGRTETLRLLAGADAPSEGTMTLRGSTYRPRSVRDAIRAGVCLIPEDRKGVGLLLPLSVGDNIVLPRLRRHRRGPLFDRAALEEVGKRWSARLDVRTPSVHTPVETLSGGNQQKVVLAKWLAMEPSVVLLDEPTRGVDVAAKAEIHALVRRLAADGAAVVVVSSELPELLAVADRIAVMREGRVTGVVDAATADEESVLALAMVDDGAAA
jgi:ABC-type sugar transport system ATPase subunit